MTPAEKKERIQSLTNLIDNFQRKGLQADTRCIAAVEELDRLQSGGLEFKRSFDAIRAAAARRAFIAYGDVADASNVPWSKARRPISRHLDELCYWAHLNGWPLITSIVVEQPHLKSGELGEDALAGFVRAATRCGIVVGRDEHAFLRAQQERTFEWAAGA